MREEDRATLEDGLVREVLRDHRLTQALRGDEHDVARVGEVVAGESALDELAVDLGRPGPVEVDHRLEAAEVAVREATLQAASGAVLLVEVDDVLEQLRRAPAFSGRPSDEIVELRAGGGEPDAAKTLCEVTHWGSSWSEPPSVS